MTTKEKPATPSGPTNELKQALAATAITAPPTDRAEIFGNEAERFDDLKAWSYDDLKTRLITLNNTVRGDQEPVSDFIQKPNIIAAGWMGMAGADIHFPNPGDKDVMLQYALEKAKAADNIQDASLILGTAVVAVHPFADGNGRVSRALYASLSMGWDETNPDYQELVRPHAREEQDEEARDKVNLGSIFEGGQIAAYADWYCYRTSGLEVRSSVMASYDRDGEDRIQFPEGKDVPHVDGADLAAIKQAVGIGEDGRLRTTDVQGLRFAITKVLSKHGLEDKYKFDRNDISYAKINDILEQEDTKTVHELADAIGEYRKLRVKAAIDFLTDEVGGKLMVPGENDSKIPIKQKMIAESNNYASLAMAA